MPISAYFLGVFAEALYAYRMFIPAGITNKCHLAQLRLADSPTMQLAADPMQNIAGTQLFLVNIRAPSLINSTAFNALTILARNMLS